MAARTSGSGRTRRGTRRRRAMRLREREIFVSPATTFPFSSTASSVTFCAVDGKIRPRIASTCADTCTALGKSPVTFVSAVRNRFPKLWPASPRPAGNRYWKRSPSRSSSLDRATMQLRMSPGGRTRYSRRRRPELPPSSVTVTTAVKSEIGCFGRRFPRSAMCSFRPRSTAERPVPPPSATTRTDGDRRSSNFFMGRARDQPAELSRSG